VKGPVNSYSLKWSLSMHGVLLFVAVVLPLFPYFRPKEVPIPLDFTVVLEENLIEQNVPQPAEPQTKKAPEPEPMVEPEPDAPPPLPLPDPPKDAVVIEKKKEPEKKKPPEKKAEKPPEKKVEKPAEKKVPEKKTFVKGKRIEAPVKPSQPKFDELYKPYDPSKPTSAKPLTDKMLSRAEIDKALREGARPGTRNMIPEDEISRCVVLVKRAMYDAWEQPGTGDAGPRPALLDIRLDSTGRVVSYRIRQSSGSAFFDQTVLKAAANAAQIRGLTPAFLKQYETLTVEFKLE
jgi:TonB family protein